MPTVRRRECTLEVIYGDAERAAVEVMAAVDPEATELRNIVNGRGRWVERDLVGGWGVHVPPSARGLRRELPLFLRALERSGLRQFPSHAPEHALELAARLGVVAATQSGTDFPGSIYVMLDMPAQQVAGYASEAADELAQWLGNFLASDGRADVRAKLARSGAAERHAFVIVSQLSGAPFAVTDLLIRDDPPMPKVAPDLSAEVTDVWAVSTWDRGVGFRWSSTARGWREFSKHLPQDPSR